MFNDFFYLFVDETMFYVPAEVEVLKFFNVPLEDQELLEKHEKNINLEQVESTQENCSSLKKNFALQENCTISTISEKSHCIEGNNIRE